MGHRVIAGSKPRHDPYIYHYEDYAEASKACTITSCLRSPPTPLSMLPTWKIRIAIPGENA